MNNKGQTQIMLAVLVAIIIFLAGMIFLNYLEPSVSDARVNLSCSDTSQSDGTKLTCLIFDVVVPYFIIVVLSIAGGVITERLLI